MALLLVPTVGPLACPSSERGINTVALVDYVKTGPNLMFTGKHDNVIDEGS